MGTRPLKKIQVDERISGQKVSSRYKTQSLVNKNLDLKHQSRSEVIRKEVPLTPLHRLRRFKAIRDRNLKKEKFQVRLGAKKKIMETKLENSPSKTIQSPNEVITAKGKTLQKMKETTELEQNGSSTENGAVLNEEKHLESHQGRKSLRKQKEKNDSDKKLKEENFEEAPQEKSPSKNSPSTDMLELKEKSPSSKKSHFKKVLDKGTKDQVSVEPDAPTNDQVIIEPGTPPNEDLQISKVEEKEENIQKETTSPEYKVLRRSVRINESLNNSSPGSSGFYNQVSRESVYVHHPSHTSVSYLGRVSGRRPVRGHLLTPFRKRKTTSDLEESLDDSSGPNSKRTAVESPSVSSPGWKYLPTLNKLWSPKVDMNVDTSVVSSTPYKSFVQYSDSMVVNYDEKTVQRIQDSDLESIDEPTPSSSRWYCNIMNK